MRLAHLCAASLLIGATLSAGGRPAGAATAPCGALGLRAHWPMDEPSGAGAMHDVVGGHDGAVRYAVTGLAAPSHAGFGSF